MAQPQPAKISYCFGKGYVDLWNTIKDAWTRNIELAKRFGGNLSNAGIFTFKGVFWLACIISVVVFGTAFFLAVSAVHIAILATFFLLIYTGFSLLWLIDRIYIFKHRISSACPNSACQEKFLIPTYECECGAKHTMLVPGKYGILKRKCECGNKLPTTFLNGREKITAMCPECGSLIITGGKAVQHAIPIIGGPSVGKTCYVNMVVDMMINSIAPTRGWTTEFNTETDSSNHARAMNALSKGIRLEKTTYTNLTAYKFLVKSDKLKVDRQIFIYDIAGEMFSSSSDVQSNKAYSYADGFIFIIDPLSIGRYAMEKDDLNLESYGVSSKDFDDILGIMLINLEKMFNLKPKDILKRNLAVVINKCDIPGLDDLIGDTAAQEYMASHEDCKDILVAKNEVCKNFLEQYDSGNFARTAESKFQKVQYFTCSALGHNKEGIPYEPKGVEPPLLWLLEMIDPAMKQA